MNLLLILCLAGGDDDDDDDDADGEWGDIFICSGRFGLRLGLGLGEPCMMFVVDDGEEWDGGVAG